MKWRIVYTAQARRDARKLGAAGLRARAEALIGILERDPFQDPPAFERLVGDLKGAFSRRINIQHRLVYQIFKGARTIKIIRMWTHYD